MIRAETVMNAVMDALVGSVNRGLTLIEGRAKELAPVRKIFKGQDTGYTTRHRTMAEISLDRDVRRQLGLGPEQLGVSRSVVRRVPQRISDREVVAPGRMRSVAAQHQLDRRGRYELRSGRAIFETRPAVAVAGTRGQQQLGGRLRDEIHVEPARIDGRRVRGRVVSPTPYAKYQEFGTHHNPAHPYLRPAGHENIARIATDVRRTAAGAVQRTFKVRIKATVTLKEARG